MDRQHGGRRPSPSRTGRDVGHNHNSALSRARDVERDGWRGDDAAAQKSQLEQAGYGASSGHRGRPAYEALELTHPMPAGSIAHSRHGAEVKSKGDAESYRNTGYADTGDGHLGDGRGSNGDSSKLVDERRGGAGRPLAPVAFNESHAHELGVDAPQVQQSQRSDKRRLVDSEQGGGRASLLQLRGGDRFDVVSNFNRNIDGGAHGFQGNGIPPPRKQYPAVTPGNANGYVVHKELLGRGDWGHGGAVGGLGSEMATERKEVPAPGSLPHPPAARPLPAVAARAQGARLMIKGTHPAVPERRIHALASDFGVVGKIEVLEVSLMVSIVSTLKFSRQCGVHERGNSHQL